MTLSKHEPSGGEAEDEGGVTPYKGSRCCVGFFQCQLCSHEWSSVYSWANSAQLCKPCSAKRRQTWVMPFRQIPKSRKYEFFCIECDQYIAESYRARDAHQGIPCKACTHLVFPDWEFPCDACNVVHLYSFSKSEAMRGIDCDCGAFLFPKHMKSLNKKHESRFCQKCQELGVNCCNFKAKPVTQGRPSQKSVTARDTTSLKKKPTTPKGRGKPPRVSVSSVEAEGAERKPAPKRAPKPKKKAVSTSSVEAEVVEKRASAPKRSTKPRKKMTSTSSVEGEAPEGKKSAPRRQNRRPKASVSSVDAEIPEEKSKPVAKKPPRNRRPKVSVSSVEGEAVEGKKAPARKSTAPKGRKKSSEVVEEVVEITTKQTQRVTQSAPRGGRAPKLRGPHAHVYAEENVLRHAPTPKNSVATDPGIRERTSSKRAVKARQPRRPRVSGGADSLSKSDKEDAVAEAEVDALADKVAEAVIISARKVVEKEEKEEAPRQQKDENDNFVEEAGEETGAVVKSGGDGVASSSPKAKANVELKAGHPPALKVGGRRRVSSHRKSESEGKKAEVVAEGAVVEGEATAAESTEANAEADPEKSQLQVASKFTKANHSEMTSVPLKPSPTKEVNRMAKVHPHHPTNKHPIQQPKKC